MIVNKNSKELSIERTETSRSQGEDVFVNILFILICRSIVQCASMSVMIVQLFL